MIVCGISNTKAVLDCSKMTLRASARIRQLESVNACREAFDCALSIDITWPYKVTNAAKSDTIHKIMFDSGWNMWHLHSMSHTDMDHKLSNMTNIKLSSKEVANSLKKFINENNFTPLDPGSKAPQGKGRRGTRGSIRAAITPYTGNKYETNFKKAVANALPRLAMLNGSDIYVDPSYKDGAVINAAGELLLWVAITHHDVDSYMEVFAADSIYEKIGQQIDRIVTELLNDTDTELKKGADLNSIYTRHADEINRAQSEADKFVNLYTQYVPENLLSDKDYCTKSAMTTYLSQTTKAAILTELDQLCILATFERKEHIEEWELALPTSIEDSQGKTRQRKDEQGNAKFPDATRSTESHHISCRQTGLTRRMGFQAKYYHQESALVPALEAIGIVPNPESDQEEKPFSVFEPMGTSWNESAHAEAQRNRRQAPRSDQHHYYPHEDDEAVWYRLRNGGHHKWEIGGRGT